MVEAYPQLRSADVVARLIDELHLAFRPVLMGSGENLFAGVDMAALGYRCVQNVSTEHTMHVVLKKEA